MKQFQEGSIAFYLVISGFVGLCLPHPYLQGEDAMGSSSGQDVGESSMQESSAELWGDEASGVVRALCRLEDYELEIFGAGQGGSFGAEPLLADIFDAFNQNSNSEVHLYGSANRDLTAVFQPEAVSDLAWNALRWHPYLLRGRVIRVEPYPSTVLENNESGDSKPSVYACLFQAELEGEVEEAVFQAWIVVRDIPRAWAVGQVVDYSCEASSVLLGAGQLEANRVVWGGLPSSWRQSVDDSPVSVLLDEGDEGEAEESVAVLPCFVAPHIAWFPSTYLGTLGMDAGLLDHVFVPSVEGENGRPRSAFLSRMKMTALDREPFFAMMAAVQGTEIDQVVLQARKESEERGAAGNSIVPLFNEPERQQGTLYELNGYVRRTTPIRVEDQAMIKRYGVELYYQLFLYTGDSQGNPIVVCVPDLPQGMPSGEGVGYYEKVRIVGFFYKTWAYETDASSGNSDEGNIERSGQYAPMLIGRVTRWEQADEPKDSPSGWSFLFVSLAVLLVVLFVWRLSNRSSSRPIVESWKNGTQGSASSVIGPGPGKDEEQVTNDD
jgi:hypothetical protein